MKLFRNPISAAKKVIAGGFAAIFSSIYVSGSVWINSPSSSANRAVVGDGTITNENANRIVSISSDGTLKVATLATSAQGKAGTSATLVPPVSVVMDAILSPQVKRNFSPTTGGWTKITTGNATGAINDYGMELQAPSSVQTPGYVLYYDRPHNICAISRGKGKGVIDWSKRVGIGATLCVSSALDAQNVFRMSVGKIPTTDLAGDLPSGRKGIGVKITSNGKVELMVSNGVGSPTITTTSTFTQSFATGYDVWLESNGSGTVTLYINDTLVCSTTGGPTSDGGSTENGFVIELDTPSTPTVTGQFTVSNFAQYFGR